MTGRMICSREFWTKKTLIGLGLGQFLSLLITSTGFTSSELASKNINAPTSQSFLNYVLLAICYGSIMLYRKQALKVIEVTLAEKARFLNGGGGWFLWFLLYYTVLDEKDVTIFNLMFYSSRVLIIKAKWYYYILLGLVDVEANFLVVKAYQYTSITSVMLLDCWSIPSVMLLTWIFLKTKYRYKKVAGVVVCVAGLVMVVFSDVHRSDRAGGSNPRKGDFLVIAGSTLYAVSNVSEEFLVKNADRIELMSFLGLFGAIISAIQISILERTELKSIHWSAGAALPFVGFSVTMFLFYSLVPVLLKINGSTMLNLSLLTSDMWAVLIRIFAYHQKVDWMYFVAFAAVTLGLIIYSGGEEEEDQRRDEVADGESVQRKHFDEETGSRNLNRGTTAGSSKLVDTGKHGSPSSIGGRVDVENRSLGKGTPGKLS